MRTQIEVVDATARPCPFPVLQAARFARQAAEGTVFCVLAHDAASRTDIPAWCRMTGHRVVDAGCGSGWQTICGVLSATSVKAAKETTRAAESKAVHDTKSTEAGQSSQIYWFVVELAGTAPTSHQPS